jgi:cobalt-zinc-cadmium efflux system membrane fusion protein
MSLFTIACEKPGQPETAEEHHDEDNTAELTKGQMETAGVMLGKVEQKQISGTIKANGTLDVPPQQLISVSVPLGGFLKSTSLLQGSRVKKGQLIAVIENADYIQLQQDYLEARNQLELAQTDYERQEQLAKENVNATKTWQQAKSTYQTWLVKRNALLAKLKLINIDIRSLDAGNITSTANLYALIDGYVTQVNVNIGKFVNPSDVLFEIVDTEHLHAELTVFEKDVPRVKIGQRVRFTLANETEERLATVYLIGREIGEDRSIRIHCHIDKEDTELLPGMYLKAAVETGGTLVPAVPDEAIIDFQGEKYVFIPATGNEESHEDDGQHFSMVKVKTGNRELGFTEISLSDEVTANTSIVVKGAYAILAKIKNSEEEGGHAH